MHKYFQTTYRLWKLLKPFHKYFYIQLFLTIVLQVSSIYGTYMLSKSISFISRKEFSFAVYLVLGYLALSLIRSILDYLKNKVEINEIENSIQHYLQEYSFRRLFKLNPSQYMEDHSAIKLQTMNRGESAIQSIISTIIINLIPTVSQIVFSVVAIYIFSPMIALVTFISLMIVVIWTNYFSKFHRPYIKKNIEIWDVQRKVRTEAYQHLLLIKNSGIEESYLNTYFKNRGEILKHSINTRTLRSKHNTKRWIFFSTSTTISRLLLVYYSFLGLVEIGNIYAIWTWISDANGNVFNIINAMRDLPINFVELEKYLDVIDKNPEFKEAGDKDFKISDINFENVTFKYPKGESNILENFNITIRKGEKTAFVGFSGSGKSTITKLLLRMYDWQEGDIKVGNKSLREIDAKVLRQKIGYVEQHVDLFDVSIEENILFGVTNKKIDKNKLKEKVNEVVYKARIDQFFHRLGDSMLDTVIGERGIKLSGGERQRIGIARALIKEPEILIFDEATASLDTENEKYIQEAIDESSKGITTIVIAHRLSTVVNADNIIVMDKGQVVGQGKYEDLKENNIYFKRLIDAQKHSE